MRPCKKRSFCEKRIRIIIRYGSELCHNIIGKLYRSVQRFAGRKRHQQRTQECCRKAISRTDSGNGFAARLFGNKRGFCPRIVKYSTVFALREADIFQLRESVCKIKTNTYLVTLAEKRQLFIRKLQYRCLTKQRKHKFF